MSWRDTYPVHPCADVFPMMPDAEIDALAADIKANGLRTPIVSYLYDGRKSVLDGRNRLEALSRLGLDPEPHIEMIYSKLDAAAYVISQNIRRRHLTKQEQAELIVRTIEAAKTHDSTDRATVARSVIRDEQGHVVGSTKDPILTAAVTEAAKHGISKRTVQNARATLAGKASTDTRRGKQRDPLDTPSPVALPIRSRGVGVQRGNEAVDCLKRIPKHDPLRARGFQIVTDWIRRNT